MAEIFLVRHGQASFGKPNYDELSDLGRQQSEILGRFMRAEPPPSHLICGSLNRHRQTLDHWLQGFASENEFAVQEDTSFNEFDHENVLAVAFPEFSERNDLAAHLMQSEDPKKAFHRLYQTSVERWTSGQYDQDYAEAFPEFQARCVKGFQQLIMNAESGDRIWVFTSGGPIGMCLQMAMNLSNEVTFKQNATLANTGVSRFLTNDDGACTVSYMNAYAHLQSDKQLITYR